MTSKILSCILCFSIAVLSMASPASAQDIARFTNKNNSGQSAVVDLQNGQLQIFPALQQQGQNRKRDGYLDYTVANGSLDLNTILAGNQGQGLGSIMMLAFARQANRQNRAQVRVMPPVAPTARNFYTQMGFIIDGTDPTLQVVLNHLQQNVWNNNQLTPQQMLNATNNSLGGVRMIGNTANVLANSQASVNQRWTLQWSDRNNW